MNWLPRRKICNTLTLFKLRKLDKVQQPCEPVSRVSCTDLTLHLLFRFCTEKVCAVFINLCLFWRSSASLKFYLVVVQYVDLNTCM